MTFPFEAPDEYVRTIESIEAKIIDLRDNYIWINVDEARALNKLLRIHHGLFRETEEYIHLLRLINGLGTFVDKHDMA